MTAEITFSDLFRDDRLRGFFFRSQAEDTFNEVTKHVVCSSDSKREVRQVF